MGARRRLAVPLAAALAACGGAPAVPGQAQGGVGARRDGSEVAYAVDGYTRPTAGAGCAANVGVPRDFAVPAEVTVKFAVYPDGGVGALSS